MAEQLSARDRMLEATACRDPDYVPCSFMIFNAPAKNCKDPFVAQRIP